MLGCIAFVAVCSQLASLLERNKCCSFSHHTVSKFKWLSKIIVQLVGSLQEMETALLKLYAEIDSPDLIPLLALCGSNIVDITDCAEWFKTYKRFHALGLLHKLRSEHSAAVDIWTR